MKRFLAVSGLALLICISMETSVLAYMIAIDQAGDAHKWAPGADTQMTFDPGAAQQNGPGTAGGATWSIMADGHFAPFGDGLHPAGALSAPYVGMTGLGNVDSMGNSVGMGGTPIEIWAVEWALNQWGSVSGFTNLGQVVDGDGTGLDGSGGTADNDVDFPNPPDTWNGNGASDLNGGNMGDIRIAAFDYLGAVLADTFQPGTDASVPFGNIGGDGHFSSNSLGIQGFHWLNDPLHSLDFVAGFNYDPIGFDFPTTVLHEMGHALGLTHRSEDPAWIPPDGGVLMDLYAQRRTALRVLTADDIAGIQAIYGPAQAATIPEPGTLLLMGSGIAGLLAYRRKKQQNNSRN